jgi:hypothetical protein
MKRLMLMTAIFMIANSGFAQTECSKTDPIFKSDNYGTPKDVSTFGSNPEFRFLRNLATPQDVAMAIKKAADKPGAGQLNAMLKDIGFAHGARDVNASAISSYVIPSGTKGNMGDGNYSTSYVMLTGERGIKSWKITSQEGCYLYILAQCGNAFYPAKAPKTTVSLEVPINMSADTKDITVTSPDSRVSTAKTYIYYERAKREQDLSPEFSDLKNPLASNPVLLNTTKKMEPVQQTYRISVSPSREFVNVYEDQSLDVPANINVEKTSEYTGYYPAVAANNYKQVSRWTYLKSARKMRHALRKEEKIAHITNATINTDVAP